tara:strand:- start:9657 stop:10445 length:789 start_codon:yes stop_codon:yes gene_type:complete
MKRYFPLGLVLALCIYPFFARDFFMDIDSTKIFLMPGSGHWGGMDSLGRDLLQRSLVGAGISLLICFFSLFLTYSIGLVIGSILSVLNRSNHLVIFVLDVFDSIPNFLLVALFSILINRGLSSGVSPSASFFVLVISIGLAAWPPIARNVRLEILQLRGREYLSAAVLAGGSFAYIVRVHYIRALWPWLRTSITHSIPQFLLIESILSFTGFGMGPQHATLGYLIYEGWKNALLYPHLFLVPASVLCVVVFILTTGIQESKT